MNPDPVVDLIRRCRRRAIVNLALHQLVWASAAGFAVASLIFLAGTRLLDGRVALLSAAGLTAAAVYRVRKSIPSGYRVAQSADRTLALSDTLSTAIYFESHPGAPAELISAQRRVAEKAASGVTAEIAAPYTRPAALPLCLMLAAACSGIFAVRYALTGSLDLKAPVTQALFDVFGFTQPPVQRARNERKRPAAPDQIQVNGMTAEQDAAEKQLDAAPDSALESTKVPDVDNDKQPGGEKSGGAKAAKGEQGKSGDDEGDAQSDEPGSSEGGQTQSDSGNDGAGENGKQAKQGKEGADGQGKNGESKNDSSNSLLAKLSDAMQNLLSKLKQQPDGNGSQQSKQGKDGSKQGSGQMAKGGKKEGGQSSQQPGGPSDSQGEEGQPGDASQSQQTGDSKGNGKNSSEQQAQAPGSGMGKQDGNKDPKLAEQMQAMGKLSEIIGKRSQNITGEMTVEVQSTKQQLKTPYANRTATHTDSGGNIHRDEVPLAYQQYVRQYFEQVRKQAESQSRQ